jgi:two-component system nitrogen regulation response regulator GlnG/two-component system response regulator HydG
MTDTTTIDESDVTPHGGESPGDVLGLAVAWAPGDLDRLGEVIAFPPEGGFRLIGRGNERPDDPHPRAFPARYRPGRRGPTPHTLGSAQISRVQLIVRADGVEALDVENVGRCPLLHNGKEGSRARVEPGDTLQLGGALLFLCVRRPRWMPGEADPRDDDVPFGSADEGGIVGESPAAWRLRRRVEFVASRPDHVLILGPSGTGKELVARDIHARSSRAQKPMVSRSAATFPEGLIDAELFGNVKNFPNPGMPDRPGLVGKAAGTTLFLDEFAELPAAMQAHLLRVLDEGEYQRLGETEVRRSDFRLIAATNRRESALKHDVLARLTFHVHTPGLEERREDVPLLVVHLMRQLAREHPDVAEQFFPGGDSNAAPNLPCDFVRSLVTHGYTSHVRELRKILWSALADHIEGTKPISEHVARASRDAEPVPCTSAPPGAGENLTAEAIQRCLDAHNGVLEDTWRELGLSSRHVLARLVRKHRIEVRKRPRG